MQLEEEIKSARSKKQWLHPGGVFIQQYGRNTWHVRNFREKGGAASFKYLNRFPVMGIPVIAPLQTLPQ